MKSASDWAAKAGIRLADSHAVGRSDTIARALRAAYRRGAKVEREDCAAIAAMSVARSVSMKSEITPELIAKLRAKAENERELHELGNPDPDDCWATRTWIAAANPAAVVSLLNEIERLRVQVQSPFCAHGVRICRECSTPPSPVQVRCGSTLESTDPKRPYECAGVKGHGGDHHSEGRTYDCSWPSRFEQPSPSASSPTACTPFGHELAAKVGVYICGACGERL